MSDSERVLVNFTVGSGVEPIVERMHAKSLGGGRYVLDNSPFYAFDISAGDVFLAKEESGALEFSSIVSRGGHSTYRVKLPREREHFDFVRNWPPLADLGCTFEGSSANVSRLYAIDVPPKADVRAVYRILEEKAEQGEWDFEEAHFAGPEEVSVKH